MKVMINQLMDSKNNFKINVKRFGNIKNLSDLYYVIKMITNKTNKVMKNQKKIKECLNYIEQIKEHYQLGISLFGKSLEECEKDRDEEIAKVNEIIKTLNK
jgi:succinate dehydrogenase/fumarate reductase flavoprotein subunit